MLNLVVERIAAGSDAAASAPLTIDWGALGIVLVVGFAITVFITASYAFGTRLLAVGAPDVLVPEGAEADGPGAVDLPRLTPRPLAATLGGWLCYLLGAAAVVYGIYLVIPAFHQ